MPSADISFSKYQITEDCNVVLHHRQLHAEGMEKLLTAAGGKLVAMYGTIIDGPGAMVIVDVDPGVAPAIAVIVSSDGVHNVRAQRLFTMDEVNAIRQKRIQLQASYRPPGQ
jgi:hypothetical protein